MWSRLDQFCVQRKSRHWAQAEKHQRPVYIILLFRSSNFFKKLKNRNELIVDIYIYVLLQHRKCRVKGCTLQEWHLAVPLTLHGELSWISSYQQQYSNNRGNNVSYLHVAICTIVSSRN